MRSAAIISASLVAAILAFAATAASAQVDFGLSSLANSDDLTLTTSPEHPAPGDSVRVTAESSSLDLQTADIEWLVNSAPAQKGASPGAIDVVAGPFGSETDVAAIVRVDGVERASAMAAMRPTELDLLWESDSFTPPFFPGRALPSAGTHLRLEAMPRLVRSDGTAVPVGDITFTWRRNGSVMGTVSGRGKSRITVDAPALFGNDTIAVEAKTDDGQLDAAASAQIPSLDPVLDLYEDNALFGVLYHRALGAQTSISQTETSFAAIPYFAEAQNADDPALSYAWQVNGAPVSNDLKHPSEITINAQNSSGAALIELALTSPTNFFLQSFGKWGAILSGDSGNPFQTPTGFQTKTP